MITISKVNLSSAVAMRVLVPSMRAVKAARAPILH